MVAEVKLTVTHGLPEGIEYVFRDRLTLKIGRAEDCDVRLPNDLVHLDVSRHHCLLAIDPVGVRVRDLGSKNGTFVNGQKIGQRPASEPQPPRAILPEIEVGEGDEIRVGGTVFQVHVEGRDEPGAAFLEAAAHTLQN